MTDTLFENWWQLLQSFDVNQTAAEQSFKQIVSAYSSPKRYYHTLEHIDYVLQIIKILEFYTQDLQIVQLAAWFHDIVYDTQAQDNEEKSANYAVELLLPLSIPSDVIKNVKSLILTTKSHQATARDFNAQVLLDADLAILASNPSNYYKYTQAIRQEYIWVPELEYFTARKKILQNFLQRENIYFTELMQQRKEITARNNLKVEIKAIDNIISR